MDMEKLGYYKNIFHDLRSIKVELKKLYIVFQGFENSVFSAGLE